MIYLRNAFELLFLFYVKVYLEEMKKQVKEISKMIIVVVTKMIEIATVTGQCSVFYCIAACVLKLSLYSFM